MDPNDWDPSDPRFQRLTKQLVWAVKTRPAPEGPVSYVMLRCVHRCGSASICISKKEPSFANPDWCDHPVGLRAGLVVKCVDQGHSHFTPGLKDLIGYQHLARSCRDSTTMKRIPWPQTAPTLWLAGNILASDMSMIAGKKLCC